MRFATLLSVLVAALCGGCGIEGINNANPTTRFDVNPRTGHVSYRNNKDVDLEIQGTFKDASGREVKLEKCIVRSNASDVRKANYEQMLGMAYQAQVNWQGAAQTVQAIGGVLAEVMPFVPQTIAANALGKLRGGPSLSLPGGGAFSTGGISDAQIDALQKIAGTKSEGSKPSP